MSEGFVLVASMDPKYYGMAINCCTSLKTFYPEASVTLFTHKQWVDGHADIFDNVITGIPASPRAKMWAMARTPYETTVYLDVDSQVQSPKIKLIFNQLANNDFVSVPSIETMISLPQTEYIDKERTIKPVFDGSFMIYKKSKLMINFLQRWYDEYEDQRYGGPWKHGSFAFSEWQFFDMFTSWKILKADKELHPSAYDEHDDKYKKLKWCHIEKFWNSSHYNPRYITKKRPVIVQIDSPSYKLYYKSLYDNVIKIARSKDEVCRVEK